MRELDKIIFMDFFMLSFIHTRNILAILCEVLGILRTGNRLVQTVTMQFQGPLRPHDTLAPASSQLQCVITRLHFV